MRRIAITKHFLNICQKRVWKGIKQENLQFNFGILKYLTSNLMKKHPLDEEIKDFCKASLDKQNDRFKDDQYGDLRWSLHNKFPKNSLDNKIILTIGDIKYSLACFENETKSSNV